MSKNFRHITPYDLPEHTPDQNLWDKIEDSLDEIEATAAYKSLPEHKPKSAVWANIESALNSKPTFDWTRAWYGGVAIILVLAIFLVQDFHKTSQLSFHNYPIKKSKFKPKSKSVSKLNKRTKNEIKIANVKKDNSLSKEQKKHKSTLIRTKAISQTGHTPKNSIRHNSKLVFHKQLSTDNLSKQKNMPTKEGWIGSREKLSRKHLENFLSSQNIISLNHRDANIIYYTPATNIQEKKVNISYLKIEENPKRTKNKHRKPKRKNLFYELHYSKEIIAHNYSYSAQRKANSVGVELGYKINSTFFQTGINLYFVEDLAYYKIDYLQNEVVRTYMKTDHIIYVADPMTGVVEKTYVNYEAKEYDSVSHSASKNELSHYAYLRLPLLAGYQFQYSKLSVSAAIGTEFSALIRGKEPIPSLKINETRVVEIRKTSTPSYTTDWQILMGLSIQYPISNYMKLKIESQYRGEWSAYTKTQSTTYIRPYSISLKTGLLINF